MILVHFSFYHYRGRDQLLEKPREIKGQEKVSYLDICSSREL